MKNDKLNTRYKKQIEDLKILLKESREVFDAWSHEYDHRDLELMRDKIDEYFIKNPK